MEEPSRNTSGSTVSRPTSRATTRPEQKTKMAKSETVTYKDDEERIPLGQNPETASQQGDDAPQPGQFWDSRPATRPTSPATPATPAPPMRSSATEGPKAIEVSMRSATPQPSQSFKANRHQSTTAEQRERTPSPRSVPPTSRQEGQATHRKIGSDSQPAPKMPLEERIRESSHGSAWTDTMLSTPDSRRRQAVGREQDNQEYSSGLDAGSLRRPRRRTPSPQQRRVSVQGPVGFGGATNMQPQFSVPSAGAVIHPPMIGPMIPNYRPMISRPPMIPMVPRARPAAIMPPPQPPYGWMGGMSPPTPMGGGWLPQRSMPNMPSHMNQMQNRASYSAPPTSMNTPRRGSAGVMGMNSGMAMNPAAMGRRTRRDRTDR